MIQVACSWQLQMNTIWPRTDGEVCLVAGLDLCGAQTIGLEYEFDHGLAQTWRVHLILAVWAQEASSVCLLGVYSLPLAWPKLRML